MESLFRTNRFESFTVKQATASDAKAVTDLLKGVASRLQKKGSNQWEFLLDGGEDAEIVSSINRGVTYIVKDDDDLVATFNLSSKQNDWDVQLWGQRKDQAYYIHRLAVDNHYTGRDIGRDLLFWLEESIVGAEATLRLDCIANNSALNNFYRQVGFTYIGNALADGDSFSLYEKHLK
ncbi:GNAT family N-acetyltransferase [Oceanobacillus manasiensis]|uniref:GNAT family N-acetyltransferase n=1 Tax=Oceanobacillus manasiensis TaxID=586413 RepID=UPI0005AB0BEB|nr:GNAT family N-acetyltransferase [Oceanobacillus manasiensis]